MTIPRMSKKKLKALNGKPCWSTIPSSSKAPRRNTKKKASGFARKFGSKGRVEFVKSLPCAACGVVGFSENAHLTPVGEKGTGYRGAYRFIAPLCGYREVAVLPRSWEVRFGCHGTYDKMRWAFDKAFPSFDSVEAARTCELAWQEFQSRNTTKE